MGGLQSWHFVRSRSAPGCGGTRGWARRLLGGPGTGWERSGFIVEVGGWLGGNHSGLGHSSCVHKLTGVRADLPACNHSGASGLSLVPPGRVAGCLRQTFSWTPRNPLPDAHTHEPCYDCPAFVDTVMICSGHEHLAYGVHGSQR